MEYLDARTLSLMLATGVILTVGSVTPAAAAGLAEVRSISSGLALEAASAAKEACLKTGFRVSVTVVDAAGVVLATVRDDGAAPHTVSTSQRKAYTALSSRMPTSQAVKILLANPDAFGMRQIDGFLILSGGLPIKAGDAVVGAIGVSGSPGADTDEKCAATGIATIATRLDAK